LHAGGRSSVLGRGWGVVLTGWYDPSVCNSVRRSSGLRCFLLVLISNRNGALMAPTRPGVTRPCAN